jgi:NAD(P) transhydrogenase subunit alpha
MLRVFIPKECAEGETRVAATPETVKHMVKKGLEVILESGAGDAAYFPDAGYEEEGAKITTDAKEAWSGADVVVKVAAPQHNEGLGADEGSLLKKGACLVSFLAPYQNEELVKQLAESGVSSLAMELVPRITRAQKMDALSSQASIGGYKAVLLAAANLPKYFPLLMTAAGTIRPARVVVMGAGVAGLQAIATAKRLGAVVHASDIRPAVKEQIESLGGKFIPLPETDESGEGEGGYAKQVSEAYLKEQRRIVREYLAQAHVVICTALVPGKKAPVLVPAGAVEDMPPGAVIVDMAVAQGGNCELSEPGKDVRKHGVLIIGHPNLPATVPYDASLVYSRNIWALLDHLLDKEGNLNIDVEEEVTGGCLLTHSGEVTHERTRQALGLDEKASSEEKKPPTTKAKQKKKKKKEKDSDAEEEKS